MPPPLSSTTAAVFYNRSSSPVMHTQYERVCWLAPRTRHHPLVILKRILNFFLFHRFFLKTQNEQMAVPNSPHPLLTLPNSPKALKMGILLTNSGSKMGQKWVENPAFQKIITTPFGVHKQGKWAHFEPIVSGFGPSEVTKCLERDVPFPTNSVPIFSHG